jgi:hypothetical protein
MEENFTNQPVIIDLEYHAKNGINHPEHDEGVIILYRVKIDEEYKNVEHRLRTGAQILALVDKTPENYTLHQMFWAEDRTKVLLHILPDIEVDFKNPGIEHFVTKPIAYEFSVNEKKYETTSAHLTPNQILVDYAHVDPLKKTLARKIDGQLREYKDLAQEISMKDCPRFTLLDEQPVNVS